MIDITIIQFMMDPVGDATTSYIYDMLSGLNFPGAFDAMEKLLYHGSEEKQFALASVI